jgi:hypothetical protein
MIDTINSSQLRESEVDDPLAWRNKLKKGRGVYDDEDETIEYEAFPVKYHIGRTNLSPRNQNTETRNDDGSLYIRESKAVKQCTLIDDNTHK